jgi:hypothetical protein
VCLLLPLFCSFRRPYLLDRSNIMMAKARADAMSTNHWSPSAIREETRD